MKLEDVAETLHSRHQNRSIACPVLTGPLLEQERTNHFQMLRRKATVMIPTKRYIHSAVIADPGVKYGNQPASVIQRGLIVDGNIAAVQRAVCR